MVFDIWKHFWTDLNVEEGLSNLAMMLEPGSTPSLQPPV